MLGNPFRCRRPVTLPPRSCRAIPRGECLCPHSRPDVQNRGMDAERDALVTLVRAAGGRATIEPVTMLGIALLWPWSGDRRGYIDRPDRVAPQLDARALFAFLDEVRPLLAEQRMPTDRGLLAWLAYRRLAVPVSSLVKVPAWLTDEALSEAWICLPPATCYRQAPPEGDVIEVDGRVAALHLLLTQVAGNADPSAVPRDAVTTLLEWFIGPHAVQWSAAAADQCATMRFSLQHGGNRAWFGPFNTVL